DGECGFCDKSVQFVLKQDNDKKFLFAPLQGETAKKWVPEEFRKTLSTSILVEDYRTPNPKVFYYAKGAFRTLWLIGGWWKILGLPFFLPSFLYDWGYFIIARFRKKIVPVCPVNPVRNDRFLP